MTTPTPGGRYGRDHRGIFSMRSTVTTTLSRVPRERKEMAKSVARFLAAVMAVAAMALGSAAGTGLAQAQTSAATDRAALVALYNATDGPNWTDNTNWLSDEPLGDWFGVTTDANGRVTELDLSDNSLAGDLPAELGDLANLKELELGGDYYCTVDSCQPDSPSANQLTGEIPPELGDLSNLEVLVLDANQLTGEIPVWLGDLSNLEALGLGANQLTGEIPPELGDLSNLIQLWLGANQLTGEIPVWLGGLSNLEELHLSANQLTGEIPPELGNLSNLEGLGLWENQLTGEIPVWLGGLSNLEELHLSANQLTGEIPPELGNLSNLEGLGLWENQLTGEIPSELGDLSNLEYLDLSTNQLTGEIPVWLGNLSNLEALGLGGNQLTGEIPPELGRLTNLLRLWLGGNQLTGEIPLELGRLSNLEILFLSGNQLTGCLPAVWEDVPSNDFDDLGLPFCAATTTPEPDGDPASDREALVALYEATDGDNWANNTNWLSNEFIGEWHGVTADSGGNVTRLDLGDNRLTGTIPGGLGNLSSLTYLDLLGNQLTGEIPSELGSLSNLEGLHISENQLTGPIPPGLGGLSNLEGLFLDGNQLTGAIPAELGDLSNLVDLFLAGNQLTGTIPAELGRLSNLEQLILAGNDLSGEIPAELGRLSTLKSLHLNDNSGLSGPLPGSFTSLTPLNFLDLSGTGLCAPTDASFQAWLENIATRLGVVNCREQSTGDPLIDRYDANNNGTIEKSEVISAINDYLFGEEDEAISKAEVIGLINLYLFGPSTPQTPPGAPEGLTAAGDGPTRMDLSWSAPSSDGGAAITGYRVEVSEDRSTWTDLVANTGNAATSYSHTGLTAGTTRHYRVSAINSAGTGPASNIATGTTDTGSGNQASDLVVDAPTVGNSSPMAGEAFELTVTVRNQGDGTSDSTTLTYYRSDDSTVTPADTEVGMDGVAGLSASESSAESIFTYAPSAPGAYYYGACVDSMPGESDTTNNCSVVAAATVSEFDIENLPWVADGVTGDERQAMDQIRAFARINPSMSQRVAGSPWLSDGVTEDELRMLADLRDFAGVHPEIAVLVTTVPDQTGRLIEAVLKRIRFYDSGRLGQIREQPWFQDGLTEDEAALIVVLESTADSEDVSRDLLQGGHVRSDTISLPLAGKVDLFAVGRSESELGGELERMAFAVESMEAFMGKPWPRLDVIVLQELESDLGNAAAGWNSGTHVVVKHTDKNLTYHELAHFYTVGPQWLSEGAADYLMLHTLSLTGDEFSIVTAYGLDQLAIAEECAPRGWTNVQAWIESGADSYCPYLLGRQFLRGMHRALGQGVVTSALWELYEIGKSTDKAVTEDEIYQTFLKNTPPSRVDEFHAWYHFLHGRPTPGYTPAPKSAPSPEIRDALVALYSATNGPGWKNQENWLSQAPLDQWYGVLTDSGGSPIRLDLSDNRLTGPIPPELGNLSSLIALHLYGNQLTGPIPPELVSLSELVYLQLSENQLTGPIPPELGDLSGLISLWLSENQLTGPIPPELGSLSELEALELRVNELTGPIPPELGNLSKLIALTLNGNELTGPIPPELGNLSKLYWLRLSENQLTGSIPPELGNLAKLENLWATSNQLSGPIPPELGKLSILRSLSLGGNQLTGPIPPELGNLSALEDLNLGSNRLTGPIPPELGSLSGLEVLGLWNNQLSGPIPPESGSLSNLTYLSLFSNQLTGPIPPELGKLSKLGVLSLSHNRLTGPIPPELGDLSKLRDLSLSGNQLTGPIPLELGKLSELVILYLSGNQLTGCVPSGLAAVEHNDIDQLGLEVCRDTSSGNQAPDLVVGAPSVDDSSPTAGASFTLSATVRNNGSASSGSTTLRYYRSTDSSISSLDTAVGTDSVGGLSASGTSAEDISLTAPSTPGTYYYGACVDSVSGESNTGNNCSWGVAVAVGTPPATWIIAENIPEMHQAVLREEMEYSRAYFRDQFSVEATDLTVLVGDHEWMSLMYRDMTGGGDFSLVVSPHLSSGHALVFNSAAGGAVVALVYGYLPDESLISLTHDIIHEYFHVLQQQLAASGFPGAFWLVEGSATYADYIYSPSRPGRREFLNYRFSPYEDLAVRGAREPEFLDNLSAELARFEDISAFQDSHESYALSFISVDFLVEEHAKNEDLFVDYWRLLGQRSTWQQAFEEAFGMTVDDFYEALDKWTFPIPRLVELEIQLHLREGQLSDFPGRPRVELENWGTWEGSQPGLLRVSGSHDDPTKFYVTYPEGAVGTGYLSLWWSDDDRTYCLRGWYKDGDLTSSRGDATAVEFTGNSANIDWNIPTHPSTLPSMVCR